MELGLREKVVLVTGASKGIGKAVSLGFAREGARLSLCARGMDLLRSVAQDIERETRAEVLAVPCDLTDGKQIRDLVARTLERFGRIDVLVNNAGSTIAGPFLELPDSAWMDAWNLKVMGYVRLSREVFSHMKANGGRIVNVIGDAGRKPLQNYIVGGVVNAALMNFTKSLANEGGKYNIIVNAVNPGAIRNERYEQNLARRAAAEGLSPRELEAKLFAERPIGRAGTPEEVVGLILFLASQHATFVHGTVTDVNGGATQCI